jgi:hypothetical protein
MQVVDTSLVSIREARARHLPVVYAGFLLSFTPESTTKEAMSKQPQLARYLAGRAQGNQLLVGQGGLSFAALELHPGGGWYLAWLSAWPRRRSHGSEVLTEVCRRADERRVGVTLHCAPSLASWYRQFGFLPSPASKLDQDAEATADGLVKLHRRQR